MKTWLRRSGWPIAKILLALAILIGVGRQFFRDLLNPDVGSIEFEWSLAYLRSALHPDLMNLKIRWSYLAISAGLYLLFFGFSAFFWLRLLRLFGDRPTVVRVLRAYYIGQLGKYVPGKAWALILRGSLSAGQEVRFGTAVLTAFYEVLTTMAAGALLAALIFIAQPPQVDNLPWHPVLTGLLVLGLVGLPLLPGVFNVLMQRLERRFQGIDTFRTPPVRAATLAEGLLTTGIGWTILGVSVWAGLNAVLLDPVELSPATWARVTAAIGLSYVAGFLALVVPSGVGVREYFLLHLLGFAGPEASIALAVVLMRVAWTVAELLAAAALQVAWWAKPGSPPHPAPPS